MPVNKPRIDTAALLARVDIVDLIDKYVPLKKAGGEFEACCPFHTEKSPSFKVSPSKQIYHCFGCGANGDAIKFLQEHQGMSFLDAVAALGGELPESQGAPVPAPARQPEKRSPWVPIVPVPADAGAAPVAHVVRGRPESTWHYRDAIGALLGVVYRFRTSDGGKEVLPCVYAEHSSSGAREWHWMAFPEPRPLYGLDRLAAAPDATVLMVEGEKCADTGRAELAGLVTMSWPGGGKAVPKVNLSPLSGRRVVLWPDCDAKRVPLTKAERDALPDDAARKAAQEAKPYLPAAEQPGVKTMLQLADKLLAMGCKVWMMQIPAPGEKPDGWDIADAVADGLVGDALADYIRAQSVALAPAVVAGEADANTVETPADPDPAGARMRFNALADDAWRTMLLRKDDKLIDCRENIYILLREHPALRGVVWVDEFANRVVKRKPAPWDAASAFVPGVEWEDTEHLRLGLWLAQNERLTVRSADNLALAVNWAATESRWHPVREYLDGLVWDGVTRVDHWLTDYVGIKRTEYSCMVGRMFLIGMVARIYRPGCPMRSMPILEGEQWRGKSTVLRILGGEWFGDSAIDLQNKDSYQLIQGRWLYEIAELDAFSRADVTRIKNFISSPVDRFRAPYERAPRDFLRSTVFAGTTNQDEYFKDPTGNTRYWPLRAEESDSINLDGLSAARDQLFAEAVALFQRGERWHPTREDQIRLFEPQQASREIIDPWESLIYEYLNKSTFQRCTTTEVLTECMKVEAGKIDGTRQMATRIGIAMKRVGWIKKRESDGSRGYYYARPAGWGRVASTEQGDADVSF